MLIGTALAWELQYYNVSELSNQCKRPESLSRNVTALVSPSYSYNVNTQRQSINCSCSRKPYSILVSWRFSTNVRAQRHFIDCVMALTQTYSILASLCYPTNVNANMRYLIENGLEPPN